jgi:hypothetical protein
MPANGDVISRVSIDYNGMGRYLRTSEELRVALLAHAEAGAEFARAIAPVGPPGDPHRGEFKASIHAESNITPGGFIGARIVASPLWAEYGRRRVNPYIGAHTLRRAGQFLNAPKRKA